MCHIVFAVFTDDAGDPDLIFGHLPVNKVDEISAVISVYDTVSAGMTDGAYFQFRLKRGHELIKKVF